MASLLGAPFDKHFLYPDEQTLCTAPAHYLPGRTRLVGPLKAAWGQMRGWAWGTAPAGWSERLAGLREAGHGWAVNGLLALTDRRLVFVAQPGPSHQLQGYFSLFLSHLRPGQLGPRWGLFGPRMLRVDHQVGKGVLWMAHHFAGAGLGSLAEALQEATPEQILHSHPALTYAASRPWELPDILQVPDPRAAFAGHVKDEWWRAGLGLLGPATRARLLGMPRGELLVARAAGGYREQGHSEDGAIDASALGLCGLEGLGIDTVSAALQRRVLSADDERQIVRHLFPGSSKLTVNEACEEASAQAQRELQHIPGGRPLHVGEGPRQAALRRGAWG